MQHNRWLTTRRAIGFGIWVLVAVVVGTWFSMRWTQQRGESAREVFQFVTTANRTVTIHSASPVELRVGDPLYQMLPDGEFRQIGMVRRIEGTGGERYSGVTQRAEVTLFSTAPPFENDHIIALYETPASMDWVVRTMLPDEKRRELTRLISQAYVDHHVEIVSLMRPFAERVLAEIGPVIQQDVSDAFYARQDRWQAMVQRWDDDILQQDIMPLINQEIWPIMVRHLEPVLNDVGEEIWRRASLWRFGWRVMYDVSPLPRRDLTRHEFNRFVESEVAPILQRRTPHFVEVQQRVLNDVVQNDRVRTVIAKSVHEIVQDEEFQLLLAEIVQQAIIQNPRLQRALSDALTSPDAQRIMQRVDRLLEPTVLQIGYRLFGSPSEQITPEFARVLRHKILRKDSRWLMLEQTAGVARTADGMIPLRRGQMTELLDGGPFLR